MQALVAELAPHIPGCDVALAERAAFLSKADLVTEMVFEFPELQGIMGRYYALHEGAKPEVAGAVAEHYSPQGPNDNCPTSPVSIAVALADKIDSLVGFWAIDEKPTGSKDPFALRRAALGVIRLIVENKLRLNLINSISAAYDLYQGQKTALAQENDMIAGDLLSFFADRLKVHLREQGEEPLQVLERDGQGARLGSAPQLRDPLGELRADLAHALSQIVEAAAQRLLELAQHLGLVSRRFSGAEVGLAPGIFHGALRAGAGAQDRNASRMPRARAPHGERTRRRGDPRC